MSEEIGIVQDEATESLAKSLAESRSTARTLWEAFTERTKKVVLLEGHSLEYWSEHFKIDVPQDKDIPPAVQKRLSAKVAHHLEEANKLLRNVKYRASDLNETYVNEVNREVTRLVDVWKKEHLGVKRTPAQEFFEKEAKANKAQLAKMCSQAEAIIEFFNDIERMLVTVLKTLDQISWANSHEIKADGYIPRVESGH